jgi:hypothetical protein
MLKHLTSKVIMSRMGVNAASPAMTIVISKKRLIMFVQGSAHKNASLITNQGLSPNKISLSFRFLSIREIRVHFFFCSFF